MESLQQPRRWRQARFGQDDSGLTASTQQGRQLATRVVIGRVAGAVPTAGRGVGGEIGAAALARRRREGSRNARERRRDLFLELVDQPITRDDLVGVQQQHPEQPALLGPAHRHDRSPVANLDQHEKLELRCRWLPVSHGGSRHTSARESLRRAM